MAGQAGADEDWPAILALLRLAFAGMEGRIDPPSSLQHLTVEGIADQARTGEVWLIGRPALACMFLTPRPGALYLGKLAVAPAARRQGHARALVKVACTRARERGVPVVEAQVRVELVENQAMFRALGFAEAGRTAHPGFDRATSITYRRAV
jgi:ribosomal protein S18 acetylase RimI-like enzyme